MNKNKIAITLGIVCFILTIGIIIQINTIKNANSAVGQTYTEDELRDDVLRWKDKYDSTYKSLEKAEKELTKIRERSSEKDSGSSEKENQITLNNNLLGITNMTGQGVEVTLKDDPNATRESISVLDDISYHIVHDSDIRKIVNELKNAGAEAISINGQRVVNNTSIMCIGNVIKINNEKVSSPFVIKAIGFPESLDSALSRPGGYIELLNTSGVVATVKKSNNVEIPKYTGVISSKYMKIQN